MRLKQQIDYNDGQDIRTIAIRYYYGMLGKTQAIRLINHISNRNAAVTDLADKTIKEVEQL